MCCTLWPCDLNGVKFTYCSSLLLHSPLLSSHLSSCPILSSPHSLLISLSSHILSPLLFSLLLSSPFFSSPLLPSHSHSFSSQTLISSSPLLSFHRSFLSSSWSGLLCSCLLLSPLSYILLSLSSSLLHLNSPDQRQTCYWNFDIGVSNISQTLQHLCEPRQTFQVVKKSLLTWWKKKIPRLSVGFQTAGPAGFVMALHKLFNEELLF